MRFLVKAIDAQDGVLVYALDAPDEAEARRHVQEAGARLLSIRAQGRRLLQRRERIALVGFSEQLIALLDAGLSLIEAIETLAEKESAPGARHVLQRVLAGLREGRNLSSVLGDMPDAFPPLYVATTRASERSGALREALGRYVAYQRQVDVLRDKLVSASVYPLVLCGAGLLVTLFLLGYVVPRFSAVYEDLGSQLPLASQVLMQWGRLLSEHGGLVLATFLALAALAVYGLGRPALRRAAMARIARIPTVGEQLRTYQLARFYRTVGMLIRGGLTAVTSLELSRGLLDSAMQDGLVAAIGAVREGRSLGDSLESHGLTTPVAVRMLRVGERSGAMGEMMERIASFYDAELERAVDLLTRLIEPVLMTIIGLVIGLIVVLMYFPIFELAGSLQ